MRLPHWQFLLARLLFVIFLFFTASYCLVAYIPFTYQQVVMGELLPGITRIANLHRLLFWPVFAAALATILPDLQAGPARSWARTFAIAGVIAGIALLFHPLLTRLANDVTSLIWCLLSFAPLLWFAAIDWLHARATVSQIVTQGDEDTRLFPAAWRATIYLVIFNWVNVAIHARSEHSIAFTAIQWTWSFLWSLLSHALVFLLLFALLDLAMATAKLLAHSRTWIALLGPIIVVAGLIAVVAAYVIFPPISFSGIPAFLVAVVVALSLVSFAAGTALRLQQDQLRPAQNGLDLLLTPFRPLNGARPLTQILLLLALAVAGWDFSSRASHFDWEFLQQKVGAIFIWSLAFAVFYQLGRPPTRSQRKAAYSLAAFALFGYLGLSALQPRESEEASANRVGETLDEYAGQDISFRLVDDFLRRGVAPEGAGSDHSFYGFLAENTNLPRSVHVPPVDIHLVSQWGRSSARKPHIFIFVIDSLRRDYLSAYNPAVTFTPAMDGLARDSVVFENAFTRYGGTGLSEPSIWVGGLMLHKQYVTPFGPMNSLQKLLQANGYQEFISNDTILQQVVPQSANMSELDEHIGTMYYDLCQTLKELTQKLAHKDRNARPVFVYTQPQNIHVSVIDREGRSVPPGESFPAGFDQAYASRVQKIDHCLGGFIQTLKDTGMYDDSIVILTSDHGDSLGEHGRWGHAYTLFPEIVRIPLIVHLPKWLRDEVKYAPADPAFLTDLTPSLYYLLGQRPVVNNELFGRPLFTNSLDEQRPYLRNSYLVVSSYAPVYGLLTQNGRALYIADGVSYRDYAYQLNPDGGSAEATVTDEQRANMQEQIRDNVTAINHFYGLR